MSGFVVGFAILMALWSPAASGRVFTDVTEAAGVGFVQHVPNDPPDCLLAGGLFCEPERMAGGAAVGDFDGDGWPDLVLTRFDAAPLLLRNRGDGSFEDATAGAGLESFVQNWNGAAFVDIDNDADADLVLTTIGGARVFLFVNDGSGRFQEEAVIRGVALADGFPHIGYSIAAGDYDRNGWPDLFLAEWRPGGLLAPAATSHSRLMRNRGPDEPGFFDDATDAAGVRVESIDPGKSWVFSPAFVDLDGDGWQDLVLASDFGTSKLFWNRHDGSFEDGTVAAGVGTEGNGMGLSFGDYDGDGDLDFFVTSIYDPEDDPAHDVCQFCTDGNRLYRNDGGRQFSDATDLAGVRNGGWGWGSAFFDADNDGDLDLVMTNGVDFPDSVLEDPSLFAAWETDPMRFWRNDGTGTMNEAAAAAGLDDTGSGKGLAVFDYDRDGDVDVLVVNNGTGARLFRNDSETENGWLRIDLRGSRSTRDALGAQAFVIRGDTTQIRVVGTDSHFLGQSESTLHFGLGAEAGPIHVLVRWPSGRTSALSDVQPHQTLVLVEPEPPICGLLGAEPLLLVFWLRRRRRRRRQ